MASNSKGKASTGNKNLVPSPKLSQSPTLNKKQQNVATNDIVVQDDASQPPKGDDQHKKATVDQANASSKSGTQSKHPSAEKAGKPNLSGPIQPPYKAEDDAKKRDLAKTGSDKKPADPEQTDASTSTDKASSSEITQKSPNPDNQRTTEGQLKPKDLDLGKTVTGVLDALGLLGKKEDAMKEYQALLKQQRQLEAQMSSEKKKLWQENNDKLMKECSNLRHDELSGSLYDSLLVLKQKHPEKYEGALKELTFRKTLVEDLKGSATLEQRMGGHVSHINVNTPSTNREEKKDNQQKLPQNRNGTGKEAPKDGSKPQAEKKDQSQTLPHNGNGTGKAAPKDGSKPQAEKKDQPQTLLNNGNRKGNEAKKDDSEPTTESDQAKKGDNRRDPDRFRVMIPDGYQLIKYEELERMQYDLVNQRESIEELTSRLSAIASNKLKEGNPNIADLSDKNRPTKLGEQFAAMYDDQWSEAFEEMGKGDEEDEEEEIKLIEKLLDVVKESYQFCKAEADHQLQKITLGMKNAVSLQNTEQVAPTVSKPEQSKKEKSGTQSTDTAKKGMSSTPASLGGQDKSKSDATSGEAGGKAGQKPGATGGQSGPKPGTTGGRSGPKPGATGGQSGQKPETADSQSGPKPGATGGQSGQKPEPTDGQSGQKPGATGGQSGQKPGATGGQSGQKPGATEGQSEKNKSSSSSGSPNETPPATPTNKEKKGTTPEDKVNSSVSETGHIALRCARSFRKETAMTAVTQIKQLFKDKYIPRMKVDPVPDAMSKYIDRCVELMWLMAVQDPPMEIKWAEHGDRSDTNYFKFYQSKGKVVRQCVWPAVFLSAHGGIVSKGYIIGMAPPQPDQVQKKKAK